MTILEAQKYRKKLVMQDFWKTFLLLKAKQVMD